MGFWQTGYMEFHADEDLMGLPWRVYSPVFSCNECPAKFDSQRALSDHRFEQHKLRRPVLRIKGVELLSKPLTATKALDPADIEFGPCDSLALNGVPVPIDEFALRLAEVREGTATIDLRRNGDSYRHAILFKIAGRDRGNRTSPCASSTWNCRTFPFFAELKAGPVTLLPPAVADLRN